MANSNLKLSADGLKALKAHEGVIDGLYDDPSGYCTFGVGHLVHSTDKWGCFLLKAAAGEDEWKSLVQKQWPGKAWATPYLGRGAAFKENFDALRTKAVETAQEEIARKKFKKAFGDLTAKEQEAVKSIAKTSVDEQARLLAKTADDVLAEDLRPFEKAVRDGVTVELTQAEFDALVSLAFNIGASNFARSSLLKEINRNKFRAGDAKERKASIESVEKWFVAWNKSGGKVLDGLTTRRKEEAAKFLKQAREELEEMEKAGPTIGPRLLGSRLAGAKPVAVNKR